MGDVVEPDVVGQRSPIDEDPAQLVHPTLTCNVRYGIRALEAIWTGWGERKKNGGYSWELFSEKRTNTI